MAWVCRKPLSHTTKSLDPFCTRQISFVLNHKDVHDQDHTRNPMMSSKHFNEAYTTCHRWQVLYPKKNNSLFWSFRGERGNVNQKCFRGANVFDYDKHDQLKMYPIGSHDKYKINM